MVQIKKYGKSSASLMILKSSFFNENDIYLKNQQRIASIYAKQPVRVNCKNCDSALDAVRDFIKDGIAYVVCDQCHHLNGMHEDTDEFCQAVYTTNSGESYAANYKAENIDAYNYRTVSIYLPKAEFLYSSLLEDNVKPQDLEYLDFGAGSGYFVSALRKIGLAKVSGTDVSVSQVNMGNAMLGEKLLDTHPLEDMSLLQKTKAQVVSMIGVLEHLRHPREALKMITSNSHVKYLYISVPTFSLSAYLEMVSPGIFHRQLSGGHTHLYTDSSLSHLSREFGFDIMAQWWFGADMVDLFRHISVALAKQQSSSKLMAMWKQDGAAVIDAMQLELDKKHFASEVHMVLKKP